MRCSLFFFSCVQNVGKTVVGGEALCCASQDIGNVSASGTFAWSAWSFRSAAADVFGSGFRPWVLEEEGALVVEDHQRGFCLEEVGECSEQGAADAEAGSTHEDGAVVSNASHPNTVGPGRSGPRGRARCFSFRSCFPCLLRGDSARQPLVWALGVIDRIEPVDLLLQPLEGLG